MGNRKKNGKRWATSSSEQSSMRAWDLAEEVDKKLTQAKAVCGLMLHMKDMDELIEEAAWAAESYRGRGKSFQGAPGHGPEGGAIMSDPKDRLGEE
jgi:hypothetical protein